MTTITTKFSNWLRDKNFTHIRTGVKLDMSYDSYKSFYKTISKDINFKYDYEFKCLNCGIIHHTYLSLSAKLPKFCSLECSNKYRGRLRREKNDAFLKQNVFANDVENFYKKYNYYVMKCINEYDHTYFEDLYGWWNENCMKFTYLCRNIEHPLSYLKIAIKRRFLYLKKEKQKVSYIADLSIKKQIEIYGDVINEIY